MDVFWVGCNVKLIKYTGENNVNVILAAFSNSFEQIVSFQIRTNWIFGKSCSPSVQYIEIV